MMQKRDKTKPNPVRQVLHVIGVWLRGGNGAVAGQLLRDIDDYGWVAFSSREKLAPTLAVAVEDLRLQAMLPADLAIWLDVVKRANEERNREILSELQDFGRRLNRIGIEPCFLKGAAYLLDKSYANDAARFLADVDCLISPENLERAYSHLIEEGYRPLTDSRASENSAHLTPLESPSGTTAFELHRHLSYLAPFDSQLLPVKAIWSQAEAHRSNEMIFRLPSLQHRIAHILAHATLSPGQVLRGSIYFRDLVDLDQIGRCASKREKEQAIACFRASTFARHRAEAALHLAHRVFGTPINDFGSISRSGRIFGRLANAQASGWRGSVLGRICGIATYVGSTVLERPSSLGTALRNVGFRLRNDLRFGEPRD